MKVQFYLHFHTKFGQNLYVSGNHPALGAGDSSSAYPLRYLNNEWWHAEIDLEEPQVAILEYSYLLRYDDGFEVKEWGEDRQLKFPKTGITSIQFIDTWNHAGEYENTFYNAPFRHILLPQRAGVKQKLIKHPSHIFRIKAPLLSKDEVVCLLGNDITLGEWDSSSPLLLTPDKNWWTIKLSLPKESFPLQYKYGIYNRKHKKLVAFESGDNRELFGDADKEKLVILHDGFIRFANNTWRGTGVAIPVFSLRSRKSFGVGEFTDICLLADWAKKIGLKMIQVLPVNDTSATFTWQDSYPYAAISAFALHPIYINLDETAGKKLAHLVKPLHKTRKLLNESPDLNYEEVIRLKMGVLNELFQVQKDTFLKEKSFLTFFTDNRHWLVPYAAFCYLRDKYNTSDFTKWKTHSQYNADAVNRLVSPSAKHYNQVALHYFIQYHLHLQLKEANDYAHAQGIILKGDIPIGIYRYSCDAWQEPSLYHMDMQAGAPPDGFAVKGQNWGFPTYHWENMAKDGFGWWRKRFHQMADYFDAFRIDHILGFFRIWSIPMDEVEGIMGRFSPAIPVHLSEFNERNIWFNLQRYTRPFINEAVLWELFAQDAAYVKENYLQALGDGFYELKEGFRKQRQVEAHFANNDSDEFSGKIKQGLFDLISNLILFEAEGSEGTAFHFRFAMEQTSSFRYLDWNLQQQLKDLYVDYFFRRQDHFWKDEAMKKLPELKRATNMLVFGEDLGMVPACVPDVMKQLGILSMEIQRMPKNSNREFFHPADAPYLSVVTPSTHDMSTIRGWWEENRAQTQRFYNHELGQWGDAPFFCEPWINKAILLQHLHCPAMWTVFQLQDMLGVSETLRRENPDDERVNIPADPKHRWKYRMQKTLEDLLKEKEFNEEWKHHIHASGRV